jgi:hypothetical protein
MKIKYLSLGLLASFPLLSFAECSGVVCSDVSISSMAVTSSGPIWIKTSGNEANINCTADSDVNLWLDGATAGGKNIYSALLAYKVADKSLNLRLAEGSNPCEVLYIETP